MRRWALGIGLLALLFGQVWAHELRPAYLEIEETSDGTYSVLWKVPVRGARRLQLEPRFPDGCQRVTSPVAWGVGGALVSRWTLRCEDGLAGQRIHITELESTLTDVLARVTHRDGTVQTARMTPAEPSFAVAASPSMLGLSGTYLWLGIEHILMGIDHLLFVFALLLIVFGWRRLVATITAFTVAHSMTLVSATLGWVQVPQQPVEAVIALSIVFLASEIVRGLRGRATLTARQPWLIAFVFGLLHGFGFAGALSEVGLPERAIPLALLFFNIGVEAGQLLFVATVLAAGWALKRGQRFPLRQGQLVASYAIGGVAAMWTIERIVGFWS